MAEKKTDTKETKKAPAKKAAVKKTVSKAPAKDTEKKAAPKRVKKDGVFAVIGTGGKQYVVSEGDFLNVEKLAGDLKKGDTVDFSDVLLVDDGKATKVGTPTVAGAKVTAEFVENDRDTKVSVIRFRSKSRYFKNRGHRQPYSRVKITKIA